ncbi:MAG: hypothetical protein GC131_05875, partial [Alphaproteobacteria bacterium]|nr:hypothetical protein [Alphaproteobacteria bacterium]
MKMVYLHIPKTAGSSFREWVVSSIGEDKVFWHSAERQINDTSLNELLKYTLIGGHFTLQNPMLKAMEAGIGVENIVYCCVVREPADLLISHFNFIKKSPEHMMHPGEDDIDSTLLAKKDFYHESMNIQAFCITKTRAFADALPIISKRNFLIGCYDHLDLFIRRASEILGESMAEFPVVNRGEESEDKTASSIVTEYCRQNCSEDT